MFEAFYSNEFDNKIVLLNKKEYTFLDFKRLVAANIELIKEKNNNVVISDNDNFSFMIKFFASIFSGKNIYLISDNTKISYLDFNYDILDKISFEKKDGFIFPKINPKETIINFYTSGSSDTPKPIKKSLFNLLEEAKDVGEEFNLKNKNYSVISTTTMCHLFGMTFHLMVPFVNGLIIDVDKVSYPENVDKDNAILVSSPTFLSSVSKYDIPFKIAPKYIISAGSKLDNDVFKYLEEKSKIIEIYGSTESGVIAHKTHYSDDLELFKNVKIKTSEDNVEIISNYAYETPAILNDRIEVSGNTLKFKTRTDRLFKIYEKRVSASELEAKLKTNDFVKNCYILKSDEKLACLCAINDLGREFLIKENISSLTKNLKSYMLQYSEIIPQKWKFIDEIPMTPQGKINKKLIEHIFNINFSLPIILDRKISKNSIIYKILFYNQCNFFKGHFPTFKLVPGVAQLYLAKEFANSFFNLSLGEGQWKRIKFSNIIEPDSVIYLKLEKTDTQVVYEYFSDEKKYSSGVFLCENIFEHVLKD